MFTIVPFFLEGVWHLAVTLWWTLAMSYQKASLLIYLLRRRAGGKLRAILSLLPPWGGPMSMTFRGLSLQGWHKGFLEQRSGKMSRRAGLEVKPTVWAVLFKLGFAEPLGSEEVP